MFDKSAHIRNEISNQNKMANALYKLLRKKPNSKKIQHKLKLIGQKILESTLKEIKI